MESHLLPFLIVLSLLWFFAYWIMGGVFFAIVTIARLGRVRKVRFSCLFSMLSLIVAVGAAYLSLLLSHDAVEGCVADAQTTSEFAVAYLGCGFVGVLGAFFLGIVVLLSGGFIIMSLSKSKAKPWIVLEPHEEEILDTSVNSPQNESTSKFF